MTDPWLFRLPRGWSRQRLKYTSVMKGRLGWQNLRSDQYTDSGPLLVSSEHLNQGCVEWNRCNRVDDERYALAPDIQLRPRDVFVMKDGAALGKLGFVHELPEAACLNSHLLLLRPIADSWDPRFMFYVMDSHVFRAFLNAMKTGTTFFGVSQESIGEFPLSLPSLVEQRAIAGLLDRKTAAIDALIAKNEQMLDLLAEKRQVLIATSVTKGLDPNAAMKESGVEWLGVIPAGWEVSRSKLLFQQRRQRASIEDEQLTASQAYGVIPQREYTARTGQRVVQLTTNFELRKRVERDDFVISMRSFEGGLERARAAGGIRSSYVVLKPSRAVDVGYFTYLFKCTAYITALQRTALFIRDGQDLTFENFALVDLPLPSMEEQRRIAEFLDSQASAMNELADKTRSLVGMLREYRQALITAAVTGQVDVAEEAA